MWQLIYQLDCLVHNVLYRT